MDSRFNKETFWTNKYIVALVACGCCFLWGSAFPSIKLGYNFFEIDASNTATQILFAGCRFMMAGIAGIIIGSFGSKQILKPTVSSIKAIIVLAMLQTVIQYICFYVGLAHTSGVKSSIIQGLSVFFSILIASLLFKQEDLTSRKIIGCLLGFAGIMLVNISSEGFDMSFNLLGEGLLILAYLSYSFSSVFMKMFSAKDNPVMLSGYQFLLGGLIMIVIGLLCGGRISHINIQGILIFMYLVFISAVAYALWGVLLKYNPVSMVTIYGFMNPLSGVILSAVVLGEFNNLNVTCLIALVLVCAGIYIVNKTKKSHN